MSSLVGKIKANKKYRIEDERKQIKGINGLEAIRLISDGAMHPKQHAGHTVKVMKYYPPTGTQCTGDAKVECMTCKKILDFLISDQFLEELRVIEK